MTKRDTSVRNWADEWYQFTGSGYERRDDRDIRDAIRAATEHAKYVGSGKDPQALNWKPTLNKLRETADAVRGIVKLPAHRIPPFIINGEYDGELKIAVRNGVVRVRDRKLIKPDSDLFSINPLPFDYDPAAPTPNFRAYLNSSLPGDDRQLLASQWAGYLMSGRTNRQKALNIKGPSGSGKGTLLWLLKQLVGQNVKVIKPKDLDYDFGLDGLQYASLATFSDVREMTPRHRGLLLELILQVIGEDDVPINRKHKGQWDGPVPARITYAGNDMLLLDDPAGAVMRRMMFLDLPDASIKDNPDNNLRSKMLDELPGMLNWALDGLDSLTADDKFVILESTAGEREFLDTASPMRQYVNDECECVNSRDVFTKVSDVLASVRQWAREHGHENHPDFRNENAIFNALKMVVQSKGIGVFGRTQRRIDDKRPYVYEGIRVRHPRVTLVSPPASPSKNTA
ncbi:DNA primase family protein [Mycobacterium colombiense]|nr:DUF5906 domain-containing protein [Mycobacterium colombiense]